MIRQLEDNDVVECINLMNESYEHNKGYECYDKNEAGWTQFFLRVLKDSKVKPEAFAVCDEQDGKIVGFMLATAFVNHYTGEYVMNVDDCIVDHSRKNNAFTVARLFDSMIDHVKKHGGKHWRADSARNVRDSRDYIMFLQKRYDGIISHNIRGRV